jgi:hypothetical protein
MRPALGNLRRESKQIGRTTMPTMSDNRRKKIQARQRKAENAEKRAAKIAKKERNAKPRPAAKKRAASK